MTDLWQAALFDLEKRVNRHNYESWFRPIRFYRRDGRVVYLEVSDDFFKAWIEDNYKDLIKEAIERVSGLSVEIMLGVYGEFEAYQQRQLQQSQQAALDAPALFGGPSRSRGRAPAQPAPAPHYPLPPTPQQQPAPRQPSRPRHATEPPAHAPALFEAQEPHPPHAIPQAPQQPLPTRVMPQPAARPVATIEASPSGGRPQGHQTDFFDALDPAQGRARAHATYGSFEDRLQQAGLNPRYTFDEFVVGESNRFTHTACTQIARHPGRDYNPLFIFGGVGLGKTHLMHAIGNDILSRHHNARVVYLSSEAFINRLVTSMKRRDMNSFRAQFRDRCDVLLIDDIQFIGGKESTQEEFFHTFNALYHSGKQIVMTSDKSPQELPGIEERLQSRFSWGLIADVQQPALETRLAIIEKKAQQDGIRITREVAYFLAEHIQSNVRELEGTLTRLGAQASFAQTTITLGMVRDYLRLVNIEEPTLIGLGAERIITCTADYFGITPKDIKSSRRTRNVSEPRQYAMYLSREHTEHSYPELGTIFGGKNHTSVLAAWRKIDKLVKQEDHDALKIISELRRLLHIHR